MKRRPLFTVCVAVIILIACLLYFRGEAFFASEAKKAENQFKTGEKVDFSGEITRIQENDDKQVITLRDALIVGRRSRSDVCTPLESAGLLLYLQSDEQLFLGERVIGCGEIQRIEKPTNPGQFHARNYYNARKIDFQIFSAVIKEKDEKADWYLECIRKIKHKLKSGIAHVFGEEDRGIMESVLLGDRQKLDSEVSDLYQLAGIAHLLAISGLHIGLAGRGLYNVLRKMGANFLISFFLSMLLLISYGQLTGMGASALRAIIMFGIAMFARVCGRSNDILTATSFAFMCMCLENPWILTQPGVWLSFGAVFAIGGVVPILEDFFLPKNALTKSLLLSFSINLITFPILAFSYYQLSIYSVFINVIVLPLMPIVFVSGFAGTIFGIINVSAGSVAAFPAHIVLKHYSFLAEKIIKLPGAIFLTGKPRTFQIIIYYAVLALLLYAINGKFVACMLRFLCKKTVKDERKEKSSCEKTVRNERKVKSVIRKPFVLIMFCLLRFFLCYHESDGLVITMLDVGQGDGIYLKTPEGTSFFFDGGSSSEKEIGTYRILPFLKSVRRGRIDIWTISHADSDHCSGFMEVLDMVEKGQFEIGEVWLSDVTNPGDGYMEINKRLQELKIPLVKVHSGQEIKKDDFFLRVMHPNASYESESENAYSSCYYLKYKDFSALFTGDVEKSGEEALKQELVKQDIQNLTLLKVAHHGSANSTTEAFLEEMKVRMAWISVGENNKYGHPNKETTERLEKIGAKVLRTDELGAILFTLSPSGEVQMEGKEKEDGDSVGL